MEKKEPQIKGLKGTVWGAKVIGKCTVFSLGVSSKNQNGNWATGYLKCKVKNDTISHELTDKTKVEVDGFLTGNEWQNKENKTIHEIVMWCQDLRFREEAKEDIMDGFVAQEGDGDELPFV